MLNAIARRARRVTNRLRHPEQGNARPHAASAQVCIPSPYGGAPWLTVTVALSNVPHSYGESLRLRAHIDTCVSRPERNTQRSVLQHDNDRRQSLVGHGRAAAASLVRGVVDRLPAERLAFITGRRWRSWIDVQLSTSPLDQGAQALMPARLREVYGDNLPQLGPGMPRVGVWAGPAGGPGGGVARLAMLQLDERDIKPARSEDEDTPSSAHADKDQQKDRDKEKSRGFNLNVSLAQVIEPVFESYDETS